MVRVLRKVDVVEQPPCNASPLHFEDNGHCQGTAGHSASPQQHRAQAGNELPSSPRAIDPSAFMRALNSSLKNN